MATPIRAIRRALGVEETSAMLGEKIQRTVADRQAAIEQAAAHDRAAALAESFDEAEQFRRQASEARWKAEKIERTLGELQERLTEAQARERRAALERHRQRREAAYREVKAALRVLSEAQAEAITAAEDSRRELGDGVASRIPLVHFAGIALPDLIAAWIVDTDRAMAAPVPASPPVAAPPAVRRTPPPKQPTLQRPVSATDDTARISKAPKAPDDVAPLKRDECRARVLRSGFEAPDGSQCHSGRLIRLPTATAHAAAANGAVEIVESPPLLTV